ncbi:MAG: vitamin B12 dependent methionine synthase [candidate division WS1 bacterium]|nr:vitamin B12 dependent methionine synthase [candidate division WS1 bacterium]
MSELHILDHIPVHLERQDLIQRLDLPESDPGLHGIAAALVTDVLQVARPQALFTVAYVKPLEDDAVAFNGVRFASKVLRQNLDGVGRVFPYVATCGRELESLPLPPGDFMAPYMLDTLKETILRVALGYLFEHIRRHYALGRTAQMNPGSLPDWPLSEQRALFSLFGNVERLIGVRLSDTCLMFPIKSVSGLLFPTERTYLNCQLCRREVCPNRQAPLDPVLAEQYGV